MRVLGGTNRLFAVIATAALVWASLGCAPKYRSEDFTRGYSIFQLDATTYRVSLHRTAYGTSGAERDYLLYRSAELTLNTGYEYFTVVRLENRNSQDAENSQDADRKTPVAWAGERGAESGKESRPSSSSPASLLNAARTGESIVIRLLPGGKTEHPTALAAREIMQSLESRIR